MGHELEIAAADAVGASLGAHGAGGEGPAPGARCANCGVELQGRWCHACGQLWEDFPRSTWKLMGEAVEGLFHFDSRLWRTLPDLFLRPATLTRAYLEGRRASQISPLRLFLVALLAVFLAGSLGGREGSIVQASLDRGAAQEKNLTLESLTPEQRAAAKAEIAKKGTHLEINGDPIAGGRLGTWITPRLEKVIDDPERFKLILESWAERFAFMSLPLSAALLSLLYVFQRRFYFYDHVIFSLHSLSALGAAVAVSEVLSPVTGGLAKFLLLAAPIHLFAHLRGVYGSSVFGTLVRMALLFLGSVVGVAALALGLILVGLNGMGA